MDHWLAVEGPSYEEENGLISMLDIVKILYYMGLTSTSILRKPMNKIKEYSLEKINTEIISLYNKLVEINK